MSDDENRSFSIRIVDEDGDGVSGIEVSCHYSGMTHESDYTDDDGWANFTLYKNVFFSGYPYLENVYVDGEDVLPETVQPEDGETYSFVRPV